MGSGYHGGFGVTIEYRYRLGRTVEGTNKTFEMCLNPHKYVLSIVRKYEIKLRGSRRKIEIVFNPSLNMSLYGRIKKDYPHIIELGPAAFSSEFELAKTIAHELNHARSYLKGGNAPEESAYNSEDKLYEYMKGMR